MRTGTGKTVIEAALDAIDESLLTADSGSIEFKQVDGEEQSTKCIQSNIGELYEVEVFAEEGRVFGLAVHTDSEDPPVEVELHTGGWF